jgi:hypothetical protein
MYGWFIVCENLRFLRRRPFKGMRYVNATNPTVQSLEKILYLIELCLEFLFILKCGWETDLAGLS